MSKRIVVVGSINLDLVANVTRMPEEGETLTGQSFAMYPGGKGANQAVGAARLGGNVTMIGRLGSDAFADQLRKGLNDAGVNTGCVRHVDQSSGIAVITVTEHGGNSIVVIPGANARLLPNDLDEHQEEFQDAAIILAQLEVPIETVEQLGRIATAHGVPFLLDPAPAQALSVELLRTVTWLTPNESETSSLLEHLGHEMEEALLTNQAIEEAAERILASGVRNILLKLGSRGVYVAGKDVDAEFFPAFVVKTVDTTAAGDAFNAGLAYALTEGMKPKMAIRFASAVAALSVTRLGAQPSMPSLSEVNDFLATHGPSV